MGLKLDIDYEMVTKIIVESLKEDIQIIQDNISRLESLDMLTQGQLQDYLDHLMHLEALMIVHNYHTTADEHYEV